MVLYIKVKDNKIDDIKFKTFGCGAAIAVSSMITEMAKGKTIEEALKISNNDVASELDGLPKQKMHCSNLGADALHNAIKNYQERQAKGTSSEEKTIHEKETLSPCLICNNPKNKDLKCKGHH